MIQLKLIFRVLMTVTHTHTNTLLICL